MKNRMYKDSGDVGAKEVQDVWNETITQEHKDMNGTRGYEYDMTRTPVVERNVAKTRGESNETLTRRSSLCRLTFTMTTVVNEITGKKSFLYSVTPMVIPLMEFTPINYIH